MSVRVRVQGKIVEQFTCDCPDCGTQEHTGDHVDIDMDLTVKSKYHAEHAAEEDLLVTFPQMGDWESYEWEKIKVTVLIDEDGVSTPAEFED